MEFTLEFLIGSLAGIFTTGCFLPQLILVIKTKHTKDLSLYYLLFLNTGILLWLVFGLLANNIPIILANFFSLIFAGIILYYKVTEKKRHLRPRK